VESESAAALVATVYRYFANADALLAATALAETGKFLDILAAHLQHITDPAEAVVEGIAYTLEKLPQDRYLGFLLTPGRAGTFSASVTCETALAFGRAVLERMAVDWDRAGSSFRVPETVAPAGNQDPPNSSGRRPERPRRGEFPAPAAPPAEPRRHGTDSPVVARCWSDSIVFAQGEFR
jgi:AcrR family transcriptional regulator